MGVSTRLQPNESGVLPARIAQALGCSALAAMHLPSVYGYGLRGSGFGVWSLRVEGFLGLGCGLGVE